MGAKELCRKNGAAALGGVRMLYHDATIQASDNVDNDEDLAFDEIVYVALIAY